LIGNIKVKIICVTLLMFFISSSLFSLERRRQAVSKNRKKVLILTKNGNVLNPLDYLKKNVFDTEESENLSEKQRLKKNIDQMEDFEIEETTEKPDYEQQYQKGLKNFNEGNYKDALEIFSKLLPLYPSKRNIIYYLNKSQEIILQNAENVQYRNLREIINSNLVAARSCLCNKEYIKAYAYYERIILLDSSKKDIPEEIKKIDKIMKNVLNNREHFNIEDYHYAKSYFLFKSGKMDKCIDEWMKILALNPKRTEIKNYLDLFADKTKKTKSDLRKVNFLLSQGIKLYNNKKYTKAKQIFYKILFISNDEIAKLYLKMIEQDSKQQDMFYIDNLKKEKTAKSKEEKKRYKETLQEIVYKKRNLEALPKEKRKKTERKKIIDTLYKKGLDFYYLGDMEKAKLNWEKILEYDSQNKKALKSLKKIYDMQK